MTKGRSRAGSCCTCGRLLLYFWLVVNIDSLVAGPLPPASLLAGARAHRYSSFEEGEETGRGKRFHPFLDNQDTGGTANVLDDLCRSHGDELASTSDQERIGRNPPTIDVLHEMFDPSFGLAPHISYTVSIGNWKKNDHQYAISASQGKLSCEYSLASWICGVDGTSDGSIHQVILLQSPIFNLTWVSKIIPDIPETVTFRLLEYSPDVRKFVNLAVTNHTLLPGCYLKLLHTGHGVLSNAHLENSAEQSASLGCSLLLSIPLGSNAELSLRKLKLFRPHSHECYDENQLQWASTTNNWNEPTWSFLEDTDKWSIARNFCGKVQDYAKNYRMWRTFDPWVMIRYRNVQRSRHSQQIVGAASFFSLKFNVLGPCSNLFLTEHSKIIQLSDWDLAPNAPECVFRIHLPYGYRIQLSVELLDDERLNSRLRVNSTANEDNTITDVEEDAHLIQSGLCLVSVQIEDVTGPNVYCLQQRRPVIVFSSLSNFLTFQSTILQDEDRFSNVSIRKSVRLQVKYTSTHDSGLIKGCTEGVAADDNTCIWLNAEPMTWHQAEMKCSQSSPGGHLVAITNPTIQQVVDAVISNSAYFEPSKSFWIGGSDQKQETMFQWSSGEPFHFTKWFPGWPMYQDYNAQPSDDGLSNQDCVEVRQTFGQPGQSDVLASGFYWNDRDCLVSNPFVCQKPRHFDGTPISKFYPVPTCNRSEELDRHRISTIVHSPYFPRSYPKGISCFVNLKVPSGFKIVLNFDYFDLEEEEDCNYDSLELREPVSGDEGEDVVIWKRCGNWNSRLKLLHWRSNGNRILIKFTSDSSYDGNGFQLMATMERIDFTCPEVGFSSVFHQGNCYLIVPFPEIGWNAASQSCRSIQAELMHPDSGNEELNYLSKQLHQDEQFNATKFYWIGQANRFQLSIPQSADTVHHCPSLPTWPLSYNNTSMEPCQSLGGYICERIIKPNHGATRNTSIESREGEVKSPNFPAPYGEGNHFRLHIKAPNSTSDSERVVVHFKHIDIEFQENCLYDYLGLQSRESGPMQKICGLHTTNLDRLQFISDTSEVWLTFHSDYSVSGAGFHATWSTIRLSGCPEEIVDQFQSGELFSPNFPHHYLPHLNCTTRLVAPEGSRVSIKFHVMEVGFQSASRRQQMPCRDEYVRLMLNDSFPASSVTLCGSYNLTKEMLQWISYGNQLSVQLVSFNGKLGRGFHASYRFEPIPTELKDIVAVIPNGGLSVVPLNSPYMLPTLLKHSITFITRHGFYLRYSGADRLGPCEKSPVSSLAVLVLKDAYDTTNGTEIELCPVYHVSQHFQFDSIFHTLTIEYTQVADKVLSLLGEIQSYPDEGYIDKLSHWPEESIAVDSCDPNPCQNEGVCSTSPDGQNFCQCPEEWRGLFCSLTLCQLPSSCNYGSCLSANGTQRCICNPGYTGKYCDIRLGPCDLDPCGDKDRGKCVPKGDDFICECRAWYKGSRCEQRWLHIPYKPLSQRMLEEPFWLGLMTIAIVMVLIGIVWCIKRHFADKIDRFVTEELERGKLVEPAVLDWTHNPMRNRGQRLSVEINATSSRPASPQNSGNAAEAPPQRHFLGWPGFRKPSLLSITSLISPSHSHTSVAGTAGNGATGSEIGTGRQREGRTFSLDDLFRLPKRSPSPSKRGSDNDVVSQQREAERQHILQRLIASQIPGNKPSQTLMMNPLGGRNSLTVDEQSTDTELMETALASQLQLQLDLKAEKKVTFARMMEMVKAEMSSSETDTSAGEDLKKSRLSAAKGQLMDQRESHAKRKHRSWTSRRFFRSAHNNSNSSTQGSASDHERDSISLTDKMSVELTAIPIGNSRKGNKHLKLPGRTSVSGSRHASSTESLLTIIRNLSTVNHRTPSTPSSPQISDYELSSSFPTPLSTPGSPAGSLEAISQSSVNSDTTTIQVTVIDPASAQRNNRSAGTNLNTPHITLEIPTINYGQFLSPIHEVPTPLPSPSHTPVPCLRRQSGISDSSVSSESLVRQQPNQLKQKDGETTSSDESRKSCSPAPSIVIESADSDVVERRNITIVVPSPIQIVVESDSALPSPISSPSPSPSKTKPPPLHIINSNYSRFETFNKMTEIGNDCVRPPPPKTLPIVCVSEPSPDSDGEFYERRMYTQAASTADRKSQPKSVIKWENISIGSPPARKHSMDQTAADIVTSDGPNFRRVLKDTMSSSLELPNPPPLITITTNFCNSEVESDSDAGVLGRGALTNPNSKMCYLSPFACYGTVRPDIAASESNLSSSGYSSMASPGPSPSCSSKTLHGSILEQNMAQFSRNMKMRKDRQTMHRIILSPSLESSSPPPDSPQLQCPIPIYRMSPKGPSDSDITDDQATGGPIEPIEHESTADYDSNDEGVDLFCINEKIDSGQLRSAKDLENFFSIIQSDQDFLKDWNRHSLIQGQKSISLDSKLMGQRRNNLKGDSLDTKMLSMQPVGVSGIVLQSLQLPETQATSWAPDAGNSDDASKKSPVSSRSESPLSDAKSAGLGRFSKQFYGKSRNDLPYTDSDGLYDYPSSETVPPASCTARRNARKSDRRRERKASLKTNRIDHHGLLEVAVRRSHLEPVVDRGAMNRLPGSKRRVRAQSNIDFCASSSSNESIASTSRSSRKRKSPRPQFLTIRRGSSPVCDIILTIQAASSPDHSLSEKNQPAVDQRTQEVSEGSRILKLPSSRSRQTNQTLCALRSYERRRQDSGGLKRRETPPNVRHPRAVRKSSLTPETISITRQTSSSSLDSAESDFCDSNESLANMAEIEDFTDTPPSGENQQHKSIKR